MAKYRFRLHLDREGEKDFVFTNLDFIMALARTFVKEKEKALGKRGNPFV